MMRSFSEIACAIALVACGSTTKTVADGNDAGSSGATAGDSGASGAADGGLSDSGASSNPDAATPGAGAGTVGGSVNGTTFGNVATSFVLGAPDDPATTVVYIFSKAVACSDLATPGWDKRITNGTQLGELKMFGTAPATYKVVTTLTPAPGEASVNYTLSSTTGTPAEQGGTGGTVTLTASTPSTSATGSFALVFGASHLDGTFDAAFCAGGHEP